MWEVITKPPPRLHYERPRVTDQARDRDSGMSSVSVLAQHWGHTDNVNCRNKPRYVFFQLIGDVGLRCCGLENWPEST